jgi:hypothetical protein
MTAFLLFLVTAFFLSTAFFTAFCGELDRVIMIVESVRIVLSVVSGTWVDCQTLLTEGGLAGNATII